MRKSIPMIKAGLTRLLSPTCCKASLLFTLTEIRIGGKGRFQGSRRVTRLAPALPLNEVSHSALGHGGGLGHVVLHRLGNTWRWGRVRKPGKSMGQGASGKEVERWWYLSSTCAFGWEEEAGIYLKKGEKGRFPQELTGHSPQGHVRKGEERTKRPEHGRGCIPCREDLASAAISWIVRALRDLGSIATVSPTFTLRDSIRG